MKIAVMILAHKNEWQLEMLIKRLNADFDVYVHADLKWDIDLSKFKKYKNVYFITRYYVNWGSYKQIIATVSLFKKAFQSNYNYYLLISGQDLPIKSNSFILEFIRQNQNVSFVNGEKLPRAGWEDQEGGFRRVNYYWGADYKNNVVGFVRSKLLGVIRRLQFRYDMKRKLYPITYYGGWNWVNLSGEAMGYIINFLNSHPAFIKKFKYSLTGDELWVQTILYNSSLPLVSESYRFTDWPQNTPHPKLLLTKDLDRIMAAQDLFARKFDSNVDKEIILKIYELTKERRTEGVK